MVAAGFGQCWGFCHAGMLEGIPQQLQRGLLWDVVLLTCLSLKLDCIPSVLGPCWVVMMAKVTTQVNRGHDAARNSNKDLLLMHQLGAVGKIGPLRNLIHAIQQPLVLYSCCQVSHQT
jgi:hypothetical protein